MNIKICHSKQQGPLIEAETGIVPSIDFQMKMCSKL